MYEKLVSVIIPCYNAEKYLRESVESIINQSYPNLEIICIASNPQLSSSASFLRLNVLSSLN